MIDLLSIEPNKVSTDVSSYSMFLYGESKCGKSSLVNELYGSRVLNIMTEKRYKALDGANVQYIATWNDFLTVMNQLKNPKVQERFDVVSIDTVENLYAYLEKYVAAKWNENAVGDLNNIFGKDWTDLKNMWKDGLLKIEQAGYTAVFVSHAIKRTESIPATMFDKDSADNNSDYNVVTDKKDGLQYVEYEKFVPDLKDKVFSPINKMVDNILFITTMIDSKTGDEKRVIMTRSSLNWHAGSTFANIAPVLPLNAEAYKNAISDAVNSLDDSSLTSERFADSDIKSEVLDFDDLMEQAKDIGLKLKEQNKSSEIKPIVEEVFGVGVKLMDATPKQVELLQVAVNKMNDLLAQ